MKKFFLILSKHIGSSTRIRVYELQKNGVSLFEQFVNQIEHDGNLLGDLAKAVRMIEETANLKRYPKTKFRKLEAHRLSCKVYEAKANSIRIYLFHEEKIGRVIVTGGLKDNQKKDIKLVLGIIKSYQNEQTK